MTFICPDCGDDSKTRVSSCCGIACCSLEEVGEEPAPPICHQVKTEANLSSLGGEPSRVGFGQEHPGRVMVNSK